MDFAGYEIFVTDESLPTLQETWTEVEIGTTTYQFRRSTKVAKTFGISGYITKTDFSDTRSEAEGLNNALLTNPSGIYTNGFGTTYDCYVVSWEIKPVAASPKYTFNMQLRIVEVQE
jgi:ribosomal 30S subunit maturation factor RimM